MGSEHHNVSCERHAGLHLRHLRHSVQWLIAGCRLWGREQTATNYPLVRITNQATGHVFYARTHDHSTMAVATGNAVVSTNFDVPLVMETGPSSLEVVANGIPSASVSVTVN